MLDNDTHNMEIDSVELSSSTEYALLALLELVDHHQQGEPLQIRQIAATQNIPERYLEQLLANLRRGGIITSQRGAKGGYLFAREARKITILDVITCLEGKDLKLNKNNGNDANITVEAVAIEKIWQEIDQKTKMTLQEYTLQDLSEKRAYLNRPEIMYYI